MVGAVAGLLATVPMTLAMELLRRRLPRHERHPLPPKQITMRAARRLGVRPARAEPAREVLTLVAHFGFGAAAGTMYAPLARRVRAVPPLVCGIAYGLTVWLVSYMGWLPAVGLFQPARPDVRGRTALMIAVHVVWGATLGWLFERWSEAQRRTGPDAPVVMR